MRQEHQNVMMIAAMQRRHEHELAAVRKDVAVYEERCDKLEEERDEAKLQKIDVESNLEILQQKCKYYACDNMNISCFICLSDFIMNEKPNCLSLLYFVSLFMGISKAPPVQYIPYCTGEPSLTRAGVYVTTRFTTFDPLRSRSTGFEAGQLKRRI